METDSPPSYEDIDSGKERYYNMEELKKYDINNYEIIPYFDDLNVCQELINLGCDPNKIESSGITPLIKAVGINRYDIIEFLLKNGAKINEVDKFGQTPLFWACKTNELNMVHFLIKNFANINILDKESKSAIYYTTNIEIIDLLLDKSIKINNTFTCNVLRKSKNLDLTIHVIKRVKVVCTSILSDMFLLEKEDDIIELIIFLADNNIITENVMYENETLMSITIRKRKFKVFEFLVKQGFKFNYCSINNSNEDKFIEILLSNKIRFEYIVKYCYISYEHVFKRFNFSREEKQLIEQYHPSPSRCYLV